MVHYWVRHAKCTWSSFVYGNCCRLKPRQGNLEIFTWESLKPLHIVFMCSGHSGHLMWPAVLTRALVLSFGKTILQIPRVLHSLPFNIHKHIPCWLLNVSTSKCHIKSLRTFVSFRLSSGRSLIGPGQYFVSFYLPSDNWQFVCPGSWCKCNTNTVKCFIILPWDF